MVKRTLAAALFLAAGLAYAQPTPVRHPPLFTYATAPGCAAGEAKLYALSDSGSCTADDAGTGVICQCVDGTVSEVGSGSGSGNSFETINAPAGTDPVADSSTDTLNITCAGGLTCTGTAASDTLDFTMGTATAATALAANGANCSAGQFPLGVDASGAAESCSTSLSGNAATATALAANPADCSANQFAQAIDAGGALTCAAIADADVPDNITVSLAATATALAANGANCSAGNYPLGVDASGAVESCTADSTTPASDAVTEAMLKAVDAAGDEECLTYESTVGDFEWQSCGTGIGGSTGATDNAILRADGTGGATLQTSTLFAPDTGVLAFGGVTSAHVGIGPATTTGVSGGTKLFTWMGDGSTGGTLATQGLYVLSGLGARAIITPTDWILQESAALYWSNANMASSSATAGFVKKADGVLGVIATSASVPGALLSTVLVEANTAGSGTPNAIAANESGTVFTNEGATAKNHHTLPSAVAGYKFTFIVMDADGLRVTANTGDDLRIGATTSTTAGYCESSTIGDSVTLVSVNAVTWVAISAVGTWTCA